jgi:hypothetical protein
MDFGGGRPPHLSSPMGVSRDMDFLNLDASMQDLNEAYLLVSVGEAGPRLILMPCVALSNSSTLPSPRLLQWRVRFHRSRGSFTSTATGRS